MAAHEEKEVHPVTPSRVRDEKKAYSETTLPGDIPGKIEHEDADLGLRILQDRGDEGGYVLDPALRRRVLRKLDLHLMPILT